MDAASGDGGSQDSGQMGTGGDDAAADACGDGIRSGTEDCDDGNDSNADACLNTCVSASCGDTFVRVGFEDCDDGNGSNTDACLNACVSAHCGDTYVREGVEGCDDGNTLDGDGCSSICAVQTALAWSSQMDGYCLKLDTGQVKCWGNNATGSCGLGDTNNRGDEPNEMGSNLPYVSLGTGLRAVDVQAGFFTCALLDGGQVKCWGSNEDGQLGQGHTDTIGDNADEMGDSLPAISLGTGRTVRQLAKGQRHVCTLLDNSEVKCWGDGTGGQLGDGQQIQRGVASGQMGDNLPAVSLGSGRTVVRLVAADFHTCAILDNGGLKCWGRNSSGQLGLGDVEDRGDAPDEMGDDLPYVDLGTGRTATAIYLGLSNTCARLDNAVLRCWGLNSSGQLLLGSTEDIGDEPGEMGDALVSPNLGAGRSALSIALGAGHVCAMLDDRTLKCWGINFAGQLGLGDMEWRGTTADSIGDNLPAVSLGSGLVPEQVVVGWPASCALFTDGRVKCWGGNGVGQLGLGDLNTWGDQAGEMGDALPFVSVP